MSFKTKLLLSAVAVSMVGTIAASSAANAERLWDPYLRGVSEGLAAGALPPPGVYGVLDNYWANYSLYNSTGHKVPGTNLSALVEVPIVLYVPGIKVLGADYSAAAALPFDYTSSPGLSGTSGAGNIGLFNTILIPAWMSWNLGSGLFVKSGFEVYLPDASSSFKTLVAGHLNNGGLPSGNGYAAVQPDLGLSYLAGPINLSAAFSISFPVTSDKYAGVTYTTGDEFAGDYTASYAIGKWSVGLGAHQENQFTKDKASVGAAQGNVVNFGIGPVVSYQLGGVNVLAEWNHNVVAKNDVAGNFFNIRLLTAF